MHETNDEHEQGYSRQAINEDQRRKHNMGFSSYCPKFRECRGRIILEGGNQHKPMSYYENVLMKEEFLSYCSDGESIEIMTKPNQQLSSF